MSEPLRKEVAFSTPWFRLVAKSRADFDAGREYYSLEMLDYVTVLATTRDGQWVLVRQFRPAVECETLEFPAGHVEPDTTPEQSARDELREECGYTGGRWTSLGALYPDTGRLANRLWCFLAEDVEPAAGVEAEPGITTELCSTERLFERVASGEFRHALHLACLSLALVHRKTTLPAG